MARSKRIASLIEPYRVTDGKGFRLSRIDTRDTQGLTKEQAQKFLQRGVQRLAAMQDKLYAQDQWGVLLVFQAMDAAGKDGTIKHVMSGINPQGCQVSSFKAPSSEELDHDFLWRTAKALPERGRIGIFNRSYYEEVLVVRVHEKILESQKLPKRVVSKRIWKERFDDIASFERYFARQGFVILKFFLHVSKKEQKKRFLERLDRPEKNWKFSRADISEREHWSAYQRCLPGPHPPHRRPPRALVRGARGPEVVHPAGGRRRGPRRPRAPQAGLPHGERREEEGARRLPRGARRGSTAPEAPGRPRALAGCEVRRLTGVYRNRFGSRPCFCTAYPTMRSVVWSSRAARARLPRALLRASRTRSFS